MTNLWKVALCALLGLGIGGTTLAYGSSNKISNGITNDESGTTPSRIFEPVDETKLVPLTGNTHPMARAKFDQGLVSATLPMNRMLLLLKRSPEQEAALRKFMAEQQDPKSANFHHWLHAQEFGAKYGPSDADIATVTAWLQRSGFQVNNVTKGRTMIEFSGNAAQVQQAFHTEIHNYLVNGVAHTANDRDPQIPAALAPVITGIASLHNFFAQPQSHLGQLMKKDKKTGKITPMDNTANPQTTFTDGNGNIHEDISPFDFATIYNELPLWNQGLDGAGVPVAISAVSDIVLSDVATFRSSFGLPSNQPTIIHNGSDPGLNGGQVENTLDVEWSGATAPGATIVMVVSASTQTTGGDQLSDLYIIDNEIAPIMSASYGECELNLGTSGNATYNSIWQQGAAEGISLFESAGDQGSTGCENSDKQGPNAGQTGLQVNGIASSPYITAVGGTDFAWQIFPLANYWNANNNANGATAKGYIPEIPWNSTCASLFLATYFVSSPITPEQLCNEIIGTQDDTLIVITGGSGGESACTTPTGTTPNTCKGGYPKPSWQTGTGVPNDGKRDLPDVSLFASAGYPDGIDGSAYLICVSSSSPNKTCDYTDPNYIIYQEVGGTSVSSPALAGIMALVLQKTNTAQGLANPTFYSLASKENLTNCNSSTVTDGNSCIFYDTTYATNAQVCFTGTTNCVTNTNGDQLGIVSGYSTNKGYDLATGLGSVNVTNLVNGWPSSNNGTITVTPTSLTFPDTQVGVTSAALTVTVKNTGSSAVEISTISVSGTNASSYAGTTTCPVGGSLAAGKTCTISTTFTPTTTGTLTAELDIADNAANSPQTVSLSGTGTNASAPVVSLTPSSLKFPSTKVGSSSAAKVVTLKNTGNATLKINNGGITISGTNASSFTDTTTCGATVAAGASCTISVTFTPTTSGSLTASLNVADNAAGSPQSVALSGTGTASAPTATLTPTTLKFPSTVVGSSSAAKVVTLKNTGTATLDISGITISGADKTSFTDTTTCGSTLAAGKSCTISVTFKPAVAGALTATLNVADNATGSPQTVALSGTGKGAPVVMLTPTTLKFATTKVGTTTAAKVVTLKNTGSATLDIKSGGIKISGTNASSFSDTTTCGATVAAGASCTISVKFKPTKTGALTASLTVTDNAAGSPQSVSLSGTGK